MYGVASMGMGMGMDSRDCSNGIGHARMKKNTNLLFLLSEYFLGFSYHESVFGFGFEFCTVSCSTVVSCCPGGYTTVATA